MYRLLISETGGLGGCRDKQLDKNGRISIFFLNVTLGFRFGAIFEQLTSAFQKVFKNRGKIDVFNCSVLVYEIILHIFAAVPYSIPSGSAEVGQRVVSTIEGIIIGW